MPHGRRHRLKLIIKSRPPTRPGMPPKMAVTSGGPTAMVACSLGPLPPSNKQVMRRRVKVSAELRGCFGSDHAGPWGAGPQGLSLRTDSIDTSPFLQSFLLSPDPLPGLNKPEGRGNHFRGQDLGPLGSVSSPSVEHLRKDWHVLGSLVPTTACKLGR